MSTLITDGNLEKQSRLTGPNNILQLPPCLLVSYRHHLVVIIYTKSSRVITNTNFMMMMRLIRVAVPFVCLCFAAASAWQTRKQRLNKHWYFSTERSLIDKALIKKSKGLLVIVYCISVKYLIEILLTPNFQIQGSRPCPRFFVIQEPGSVYTSYCFSDQC